MQKTSFGERFLAAFGNAKQVTIAEKMGVTAAAVKNYVAGRVPDAEKLAAIHKLTNCSLHWLLTGEGPQFVSTQTSRPSRIKQIAAEQARRLFAESDIASPEAAADRTADIVTGYLLSRAMQDHHLIGPDEWLISEHDLRLARRLTFVRDRMPSLDEQIRKMVADVMTEHARDAIGEMRPVTAGDIAFVENVGTAGDDEEVLLRKTG